MSIFLSSGKIFNPEGTSIPGNIYKRNVCEGLMLRGAGAGEEVGSEGGEGDLPARGPRM